MNENWTSFIYTMSLLGALVFLVILLFDKPRKWFGDFIIKTILTKKNQAKSESYFEKYRLRSTIKKSQDRLAEIEGTIKPHTPMSDNTRNIIIACIVSFGIIFSTIIYAYSTRYQIEKFRRIDKWTGTVEKLKFID